LNVRGAVILGVVFLASALSVGTSQYAFGLFIPPLAEEFEWSRTAIGASSSFAAVSGLAAPFMGRALDRYGARPVMVGSLVIMGIGLALRPWMESLTDWYLLSFLQFICFSGAWQLPAAKLAGGWFPNSRGRVLGLVSMGNNFGGLTLPFMVTAILGVATWREAFLAIGMLMFLVALISCWLVRDAPPQSIVANKSSSASTATDLTVSEAIRMPAFYAVAVIMTLGFFTYSTVLTHSLAHLLSLGFDSASASVTLSTLAIGGICGKLLFGTLIDRLGARRAALINLTGQAIATAMVAGFTDAVALKLVYPLFGLFMGGFGVVSTLLVQECFGLRNFGAIMGLLALGGVIAFGAGPLLAGLSFDLTGSYATSFALVAGFFVTGACTLMTPWVRRAAR
jgi:MFS family permease